MELNLSFISLTHSFASLSLLFLVFRKVLEKGTTLESHTRLVFILREANGQNASHVERGKYFAKSQGRTVKIFSQYVITCQLSLREDILYDSEKDLPKY